MSDYREPQRLAQLEDRVSTLETSAAKAIVRTAPTNEENVVESVSRKFHSWRHGWRPGGTFYYQLAVGLIVLSLVVGWGVTFRTGATVVLISQAVLALVWAFHRAFN